jgi:hypothetical protein
VPDAIWARLSLLAYIILPAALPVEADPNAPAHTSESSRCHPALLKFSPAAQIFVMPADARRIRDRRSTEGGGVDGVDGEDRAPSTLDSVMANHKYQSYPMRSDFKRTISLFGRYVM